MKAALISSALIFCVASFAAETENAKSKMANLKQAFIKVAGLIKDRNTAELKPYLQELSNLEISDDVLNLDGNRTGLRAIHLALLDPEIDDRIIKMLLDYGADPYLFIDIKENIKGKGFVLKKSLSYTAFGIALEVRKPQQQDNVVELVKPSYVAWMAERGRYAGCQCGDKLDCGHHGKQYNWDGFSPVGRFLYDKENRATCWAAFVLSCGACCIGCIILY
jgi:hypothetical protein